MITHHPDDATLMSYAAGSLPEALSAVVAAHVANCPRCSRELATMNALGGVMLAGLSPARLTSATPSMDLTRAPRPDRSAQPDEADADVPLPLRPLVGPRLADIPWRRLGFGVWHLPLPLSPRATGDLRLIKVARGLAMPEHGHGGAELTLVLAGAYRDEMGTFRTGDLADLDDAVEHRPVADPDEGCICLIASEQRARFKGLIARLVQPLTGM
jgi:putative transcriptional regulator